MSDNKSDVFANPAQFLPSAKYINTLCAGLVDISLNSSAITANTNQTDIQEMHKNAVALETQILNCYTNIKSVRGNLERLLAQATHSENNGIAKNAHDPEARQNRAIKMNCSVLLKRIIVGSNPAFQLDSTVDSKKTIKKMKKPIPKLQFRIKTMKERTKGVICPTCSAWKDSESKLRLHKPGCDDNAIKYALAEGRGTSCVSCKHCKKYFTNNSNFVRHLNENYLCFQNKNVDTDLKLRPSIRSVPRAQKKKQFAHFDR